MIKLVVFYGCPPGDPQEWMTRFLAETEPQVRSIPHLAQHELSSPFDAMEGLLQASDRRAPPVLMLELYFDSRADFDAAMLSATGRALVEGFSAQVGQQIWFFLAEVAER